MVELAIVAPVGPDSKVHLTGPEVTPLEPGKWSSFSGLGCALLSPGWARLLDWALLFRRQSPVWNPDPV